MQLRGLKVLVTGGTGLIGGRLVEKLMERGADVRATLHSKPAGASNSRVEWLTCDLTNPDACRRAVRDVDCVFHCAAHTSGWNSAPEIANALVADNLRMDEQMLGAAHNAKAKRFIWVGSTTGYPVSGDRPVKEDEMFAGEPPEKYFLVGSMKRKSEALFRDYSEKTPQPMPVIVIRPTHVYGPGESFDAASSRVSAALIRKVVERQDPLEVWGTGDDIRDLIYVDDVAEAMLLAAEKLDGYETINLGTGKGTSVKEMLRILLSLEGYGEAKIVFNQDRPSMIPVRMVDTGKAEALLGFRPSIDVREGLKLTLDWYKKNYNR